MRLAFLGTPDAAVASLRALVEHGHEVVIVITRPDRRRGRGSGLSASPVKEAAQDLGLRVGHAIKELDGLDVEMGVVVAYGAMIPAALLERTAMLNVHFSILPRWRGAAPVERAILAGDRETGVSVMSLEPTLDTGPVHLVRCTLVDEKTSGQLTSELAALGAEALVEVLDSTALLSSPRAQVGEATYAAKLDKVTFHLVPTMDADLLARTVRLERAFTFVGATRLRVVGARSQVHSTHEPGTVIFEDAHVVLVANEGALVLERVQPEGARPMSALEWWKGARLVSGAASWT